MSDELTLEQFVDHLATHGGPDLRGYKPTSLERRIRKRLSDVGVSTYSDYLKRVRHDPEENLNLLNTVLINVTEFFRDPQAWQALRDEALPSILSGVEPGDTIRVWSTGCASGEEPYSIAMLISESLGAKISDYSIKIYATDIDEDALNIARRGEYTEEKLHRVPSPLRQKYFSGRGSLMRISRDLRRLVVFGRSNIVTDVPISHCNLVICRNVLIYFDAGSQKQIFSRVHYALEPGGILFLGKAESKLGNSSVFLPVNTRWRIFQKHPFRGGTRGATAGGRLALPLRGGTDLVQHEMESLQLYQRSILETVKSGLLALDVDGVVVNHNEMFAQIWNLKGNDLVGKRIKNTELTYRCPELMERLNSIQDGRSEPLQFQCTTKVNGGEHLLNVVLRPVMDGGRARIGTIIYSEDVTDRERLKGIVGQLEATSEELQSANEELETTNEELQSSNEELETTNEELQSTNEELATTNEELQSVNEELENMNEELEHRSQELHQLSQRYAETLRSMPWPVVLVDDSEKIQLWNGAAQRLFGVGETSVVGVGLDALPLQLEVRDALIRRYRDVLVRSAASSLRAEEMKSNHHIGKFDVHFTPVLNNRRQIEGVLMMFGPGSASVPVVAGVAGIKRSKKKAASAPSSLPKAINGKSSAGKKAQKSAAKPRKR